MRRQEACLFVRPDDILTSAIVVHERACLGVNSEPAVVGVHDEVDDAGHGVRTVDRRSTAGQHVDTLDDRRRHEVDVRNVAAGGRVARLQTTAVEQHQGAVLPKPAKVDCRGAGRAVRYVRTLGGERLRQRVDQIFGAGRALKLDFLR